MPLLSDTARPEIDIAHPHENTRKSGPFGSSEQTMPEYILAILKLGGWAACVASVFWLTRMAAERVGLTTSKTRLALYAIAVGGVMFNLVVFRTAAVLLEEPFDLALFAAVGFGAIAMFFAILTA